MKRILVMMLMIVMSMSIMAHSGHTNKSVGSGNVYYVVVGSFQSLSEASTFANNGPYDTVWGNVYKATVNGRTVYRVCYDCFTTKAKAQRCLNKLMPECRDANIGNPWIWTNKGQAKCVERIVGNDGEYLSTRPK